MNRQICEAKIHPENWKNLPPIMLVNLRQSAKVSQRVREETCNIYYVNATARR